jgi:hypothetical protein
VADRVMRMPAPSVQRQVEDEEEELLQAKAEPGSGPAVTPRIGAAIADVRGGGQPLPAGERRFFEPRFGYDFSGVRVHTGSAAADLASAVQARAFTVGRDVVFGAGQYAPGTDAGRRLMAHELTHVVQQESFGALRMQRQERRGAAGGCGICLGDGSGMAAGRIAHEEIQLAFQALYNDLGWETRVEVVPGDETPPFTPHLDLSYEETGPFGRTIHIGEIKPLDDAGRQQGAAEQQLRDYASQLQFTFDQVFRMTLAPPPGPYPFFNPMSPPGCPPQVIHVRQTAPGVYQYYCEPPWSQLVRDPRCACLSREPEPVPEPVPVPGPVPEPRPIPDLRPVPIIELPPIRIPDWVIGVILVIFAIIIVIAALLTSKVWVPAAALILLILLAAEGLSGETGSPELANAEIIEIPAVASFMQEHETALANVRAATTSPPAPTELARLIDASGVLHDQLNTDSATDPRAAAALHYAGQIESVIEQYV